MGRLFYLRPLRDQLLRITRWRRECAGLMGRLAVSMHQESLRSASIWARTRIFPNSKHGKIFFFAIGIGKLLIQVTQVIIHHHFAHWLAAGAFASIDIRRSSAAGIIVRSWLGYFAPQAKAPRTNQLLLILYMLIQRIHHK